MLLVINNLGGGHTHKHAYQFANKAILRIQAHTGLWPVHAWFKKHEILEFCLRFPDELFVDKKNFIAIIIATL